MSLTISPHSVLPGESQDVGVFPVSSELTVAQAAKVLRMSERHVNNLLTAGYIAFRQENGERLVLRESMLNFEEERERKHAALNRMIRMNQEMGLYDD